MHEINLILLPKPEPTNMKVNQYLNLDKEGISLYPYAGVNNNFHFSIIRKSQRRETFESYKGLILRITYKISGIEYVLKLKGSG